jgi:hypothetical protein
MLIALRYSSASPKELFIEEFSHLYGTADQKSVDDGHDEWPSCFW